jgi:hypothetical protein
MKTVMYVLLVSCIICPAFGEGYELPLYNPDLMTFFASESRYFLSTAMEYPENIFQFSSGGWFTNNEGNFIFETAQGFLFPINEYVAIPVHFALLSSIYEKDASTDIFAVLNPTLLLSGSNYFELFTGSGLVVHTNWLTFGAYAGYHGLTHDYEVTEENGFAYTEKTHINGINYAIVPVVKINNRFLQRIEGWFSAGKFNPWDDDLGDTAVFDYKNISFYAKAFTDLYALFQPVKKRGNSSGQDDTADAQDTGLNSFLFEPYYARLDYDWKTKNTIYGIRLGIDRFVIEGGCRVFDETYSDSFFCMGQFVFSIPALVQRVFMNEKAFISFSMDNHFKRFGIGIPDCLSLKGGGGLFMVEAVLNDKNDLSLALTVKIGLNWNELFGF